MIDSLQCLNMSSLMTVFGAGSAGADVLTQGELSAMASALLYEQQNPACAVAADAGPIVDWKAWVFGTIAIGIICLLSILGLLLIPFLRSEILFLHIIMFFMAVGVGTLVGDAFLHLLNEVYEYTTQYLNLNLITGSVPLRTTLATFLNLSLSELYTLLQALDLGAAYPGIPFRNTPIFYQLVLSVLGTLTLLTHELTYCVQALWRMPYVLEFMASLLFLAASTYFLFLVEMLVRYIRKYVAARVCPRI